MLIEHFEELDDDEKFIYFIETFTNLDMVTLVGGSERLQEFFNLLFVLMTQEETLVRNRTYILLCKLADTLSEQNLSGLMELANRLFIHESIPSKSSACLLMPVCFKMSLKFKVFDVSIIAFLNEILQDDPSFNKKNVADSIKAIIEFIAESKKLTDTEKRSKSDP